VDRMHLLTFAVFFIGICYSRPRSAAVDEINMDNMKPLIATKQSVAGSVATCQPTYFTNSSGSGMDAPNWGSQLLIVSQLNVNSSPLTSIAFFVTSRGPSSYPSKTDILIYNSTQSNLPGFVIFKLTQVDLTTFTTGAFSCLPLPGDELKKLSTGVYWVGFYTTQAAGSSVIGRVPTTGNGVNYNYKYISTGSPAVGNIFPSGFSSEYSQLVMGSDVSLTNCASLTCGSCTTNSECVWCLSSASCIASPQIPQCKSWTRNPSICDVCEQYKTCGLCVDEDHCAWCLTDGQPSVCLQERNDGNCSTAITEPRFCSI